MNWKPQLATATLLAGLSLGALVGCSNSGSAGSAQTSQSSSEHAGHATTAPPNAHDGHGEMSHSMGSKSLDELKKLKGKDFDIAWLSQMITHHQGALDMSKDVLKVAKRPETKKDAENIIAAQTREIEQMQGWLKSWYNTGPDAPQQALMDEDMKPMMAMPITDDSSFYEMMIPHHQGAIDMAALVDAHSQNAELKKLARQIAADQKAEIDHFQQVTQSENK